MNQSLANDIIEAGLAAGASFVEIFEEESRRSALTLKNKAIETATAGTDYGIGLRLLFGTQVLYAYTSDDSRESMLQMVQALTFGKDKVQAAPLAWKPEKKVCDYNRDAFKDPRILGQKYKLDFIQRADAKARATSDKVIQVSASIVDVVSKISIYNSEGLTLDMDRSRCRTNTIVTATDGSERITTHVAPGALGGYEILDNYSPEELAYEAADRAIRMLSAGHIAGGQMPVIMGNGFGGVIFHEACGHPLETESIRHSASPFCDKIGEQIAQPCLTAIDDGTLAGVWGSLQVDDEGTPTERTTLIENGVLKTYMSDRVGAEEVGVKRSGNARRECYQFAPASRMRNTFIAPGKSSVEEMLASVDYGLYAVKMGGGSVNPATGEFNFAVEEGYVIRNGKPAEAVRGATLIGKGHEILPKISMVGSDLELAAGMCGSVSGSVPVTVGQPTIKVDQILVGGR